MRRSPTTVSTMHEWMHRSRIVAIRHLQKKKRMPTCELQFLQNPHSIRFLRRNNASANRHFATILWRVWTNKKGTEDVRKTKAPWIQIRAYFCEKNCNPTRCGERPWHYMPSFCSRGTTVRNPLAFSCFNYFRLPWLACYYVANPL